MKLDELSYRIKDKYLYKKICISLNGWLLMIFDNSLDLYLSLPIHVGVVKVKTINNHNDMVIIEIDEFSFKKEFDL